MKFRSLLAATAAATIFAAAGVSAQDFTGKRFQVMLSGENNVPEEAGDPNGTGTATLRINPGQEQVCYRVNINNIEPTFAGHIHEAPEGQTGPIVVNLMFSGTMGQQCVQVDRELALDIIRNPEDYYLNFHNNEYPQGAVRGQLG